MVSVDDETLCASIGALVEALGGCCDAISAAVSDVGSEFERTAAASVMILFVCGDPGSRWVSRNDSVCGKGKRAYDAKSEAMSALGSARLGRLWIGNGGKKA